MKTLENKLEDLDKRITDLDIQLNKFNQIKINLMMIKRDLKFQDVRHTLEGCFDSLDDELKLQFNEDKR